LSGALGETGDTVDRGPSGTGTGAGIGNGAMGADGVDITAGRDAVAAEEEE
jgi:hypothetical protein